MVKSFVVYGSVALVGWVISCFVAAHFIVRRKDKTNGNVTCRFKKEDINLVASDGSKISAWYVAGSTEKVVILLTGIGGDRTFCVPRAEDYIARGYSILLPDLRGTGKSDGDVISFGWHERKDLLACIEYLKEKGFQKIGVHGTSLGAATIVYSLQEFDGYNFIILESCYDNIDNAYKNRMSRYPFASTLFFPIKHLVGMRIDVGPELLCPENFIKLSKSPLLMLAGDQEDQLKIEETKSVFNNCSSTDKSLYIFKTGKHEDFKEIFPDEYNMVVGRFLDHLN